MLLLWPLLLQAGSRRPVSSPEGCALIVFVLARERHDPSARVHERARAVAPRHPRDVEVCRAVARAPDMSSLLRAPDATHGMEVASLERCIGAG
jgi:hypothetical protein